MLRTFQATQFLFPLPDSHLLPFPLLFNIQKATVATGPRTVLGRKLGEKQTFPAKGQTHTGRPSPYEVAHGTPEEEAKRWRYLARVDVIRVGLLGKTGPAGGWANWRQVWWAWAKKWVSSMPIGKTARLSALFLSSSLGSELCEYSGVPTCPNREWPTAP